MYAPRVRRSPTVTSRQLVVTALGCGLIGLGVVGLLEAELGVDPYTVFIDGIAAMFDLPIGLALLTAGAVMTLAAWLLGRPPTTGLTMTIGLVAVVVSIVVDRAPTPTTPVGRTVVMLGAIVIVSIGVGVYRSVKWAEGPLDALPQALGDRSGRPTLMFAVVQAVLLAGEYDLRTDVEQPNPDAAFGLVVAADSETGRDVTILDRDVTVRFDVVAVAPPPPPPTSSTSTSTVAAAGPLPVQELPETGSNGRLGLVSVVMIGVGLGCVVATRRRPA